MNEIPTFWSKIFDWKNKQKYGWTQTDFLSPVFSFLICSQVSWFIWTPSRQPTSLTSWKCKCSHTTKHFLLFNWLIIIHVADGCFILRLVHFKKAVGCRIRFAFGYIVHSHHFMVLVVPTLKILTERKNFILAFFFDHVEMKNSRRFLLLQIYHPDEEIQQTQEELWQKPLLRKPFSLFWKINGNISWVLITWHCQKMFKISNCISPYK